MLAVVYVAYVIGVGGDFKGTLAVLDTHRAGSRGPGGVRGQGQPPPVGGPRGPSHPPIPGFMSMSEHAERFRAIRADRMVVGQLLDAALPADAVIAIHSAGIVPFYARRTTVDMWGINDAHIARAAVEMGEGTAGMSATTKRRRPLSRAGWSCRSEAW